MAQNHEEKTNPEAPMDPEQILNAYHPRPKWQLVLAWLLIGVVLFGFLGVCYWMIFYR